MVLIMKKILCGVAGFVAFLGVGTAGALWYINTPSGKAQLSDYLSEKLDREVRLDGHIYPLLQWPLTIEVTDLSIANTHKSAQKMADIKKLQVSVALLPLFSKTVDLPLIALYDSSLSLEKDAKGNANWEFGEKEKEPESKEDAPQIKLGKLDVRNSKLHFRDDTQQIDVTLVANTKADTLRLTGKGTYHANPFDLAATTGTLVEALKTSPFPVNIHMKVGYTTIDAKGTVTDPNQMKGLDITLHVKGADAAELFPLLGIALPPTPPYDVKGKLGYANKVWKFNNLKGILGSSDIGGNLSWDQSTDIPLLKAGFISKNLDLRDLGPLIGLPPKETRSEEQKKAAAEQEASPYVIPDISLNTEKLGSMNADVSFKGTRIVSDNLPLDDFYLAILLQDKVLKIQPVRFGTANGNIATYATIDANRKPADIDAKVNFNRLSLARLLEGAGKRFSDEKLTDGYIGGQANLKGKGASLHDILASSNGEVGIGMEGGYLSNLLVEIIGLDVWQSLGFLLEGDKPVPIRCIISNFDVKDGMMSSRSLVVDTNDTIVNGKANLNLKNEALDVYLNPQPKDATLVSLRSPLEVHGTLKKPDVSIGKRNLAARGGAAVAIGALLTPFASILAFVEPGLGENSDCARLLNETKEMTQDKSDAAKKR